MKIAFAGDVSFSHKIGKTLETAQNYHPLAVLSFLTEEVSAFVVNLESPFSYSSEAVGLQASCAAKNAIKELRASGVTHTCLANNHAYDGGVKALEKTVVDLSKGGLNPFGVRFQEQAVVNAGCDDETVILLGAICHPIRSPENAQAPENGKRALNKVLLDRVASLSRTATVIVSLHGDYEFSILPSPCRIDLCEAIIEAGASVVFCHHPHVLQGYKEYGRGMIFYSLGNCLFNCFSSPYQRRQLPHTSIGIVAIVNLSRGRARVDRLVPTEIVNPAQPKVTLVPKSKRRLVLTRMAELSDAAENRTAVKGNWKHLQHENVKHFLKHLRQGPLKGSPFGQPTAGIWE